MHVYNVKRMNRYAIYGRPLILWGGGQFHILHRPAIIWKLRNFCPVFSDNFGWTIKPTLFIPIKMYTKDPTKTTCSFSSIFLTRLFFEYLHTYIYPLPSSHEKPARCMCPSCFQYFSVLIVTPRLCLCLGQAMSGQCLSLCLGSQDLSSRQKLGPRALRQQQYSA